MNSHLANRRRRRVLAGTAVAAACIASSIPSASAAATHPGIYFPSCASNSLFVYMGTDWGNFTAINFINISTTPCWLEGYPGVAYSEGDPNLTVGLPAVQESPSTSVEVELAPGDIAHAELILKDAGGYPPAECHYVDTSHLVVYPPGSNVPIQISYPSDTCALLNFPTLFIETVQTGASN